MDIQEINKLVRPYGVKIDTFEELAGYISENYLLRDIHGSKYVFKYFRDPKEKAFAAAEAAMVNQLDDELPLAFTRSIAIHGQLLVDYPDGSFGRLMPYIEGRFLAEVDHSDTLIQSFGHTAAMIDSRLMSQSAADISARRIKWDLQYALISKRDIQFIKEVKIKKWVSYYVAGYERYVLPIQHELRYSLIHNDLNDWNILVNNDKVTGILDFGDAAYAPLINEVAIALTYLCMDKEDPIKVAGQFLSAYHEVVALTIQEIDMLYYLIATRLCISLCSSARAAHENPLKEYLFISEKPAIDLLEKWISINPVYARNEWRKTIGIKVEKVDHTLLLEKRMRYFSKSLSLSYHSPIYMSGSAFQYMYAADGSTYLDAYNNIPHVGHAHPVVAEAIAHQAHVLNTNTRYLYQQHAAYAEQLLSYFPEQLNKVFLVNSGSEATDLAWRLAYAYRHRRHRLVLEHGYHGHTNMGISVSAYKFDGKGGRGLPDDTTKLPLPNAYRGKFSSLEAYVADAEEQIDALLEHNILPAALIAEPISGCGGQVPIMAGYFDAVIKKLRAAEALFIMDEVQVGFGRIGSHFWGFELHDVLPDIVILGKPIANGHPMGAVICTAEVAAQFENGMEFFSSFGGNPVSCAAAAAVLRVIKDESLQTNALEVGGYWIDRLRAVQQQDSRIGDVRGHGLFIGVELIKYDQPATDLAQLVKNELKNHGILASTDGPYDNVLKMKPPLCFSIKDVDTFMDAFIDIMRKAAY